MPTVLTTRDIPTLGGVIRAGVLLSVISWGEDGSANLQGVNGWPRVSLAPADAFEEADGEWRMADGQTDEQLSGDQPSAISDQPDHGHGGESDDSEELRGVSVNAEPSDGTGGQLVSGVKPLVSDGGVADSDPITRPSTTACEPEQFPSDEPVMTASEVNTLDVHTSFPSVPPCLRGSTSSTLQERSHDLSNFDQLTELTDDTVHTGGDRERDANSARESGSHVNRDVREACPFDATGVSRLPGEVSRDGGQAPRPTVADINAELAAGETSGERYQLTREQRDQARFARTVSGGRNGWPVLRPGNKTPEQLTITVDREAVGMPTYPRSSWHPSRSHWPAPWQLAEYGITAMGRTFWCADHPEIRLDDKPWRMAVDLDRGEVCIRGHWQRMEFGTTEARRHGEVEREPDKQITLVSESISGHPPFASSQWPAPHHDMSPDERQGHRRVKNERGDIVWRCGAGPGETLEEFTAWRLRLDEFFEQKTSQETKGAA